MLRLYLALIGLLSAGLVTVAPVPVAGQATGYDSPQKKLEEAEQRLDSLQSVLQQQASEDGGRKTQTENSVTLRTSAAFYGNDIAEIPGNTAVHVIGADENYARVSYRDTTGWVNSGIAFGTDDARSMVSMDVSPRVKAEIESAKSTLDELRCITNLLGSSPDASEKTLARVACDGEVRVGMTKEMVETALGNPQDVNRTETAAGTSEQWIYGEVRDRMYVYFEGDKVDTIQRR
jgi:hypothetical protein